MLGELLRLGLRDAPERLLLRLGVDMRLGAVLLLALREGADTLEGAREERDIDGDGRLGAVAFTREGERFVEGVLDTDRVLEDRDGGLDTRVEVRGDAGARFTDVVRWDGLETLVLRETLWDGAASRVRLGVGRTSGYRARVFWGVTLDCGVTVREF